MLVCRSRVKGRAANELVTTCKSSYTREMMISFIGLAWKQFLANMACYESYVIEALHGITK